MNNIKKATGLMAVIGVMAMMATPQVHAAGIEAVLRQIEANNLTLKSMEAGNRASALGYGSENTLEPTSIEYSPFFRKGESGVASSELVVSQEFDFPTLYVSRKKAGQSQALADESRFEVTRRDILLQGYLGCLDYIRITKGIEVMQRRLAVSDTLVALFNRRLGRGDATILEVKRIELDRMELNTAMSSLRGELEEARSALTALNGNKAPELAGLAYPENMSLEYNIDEDAEYKAAQAALGASAAQERTSRQGWLPKISLGYRRNTEGKEASNGFLVGAALPIFSNSGKVKAAKARVHQSEIEMEEARVNGEAEAARLLGRLKNLKASMDTYDFTLMDSMLELMRKSVELRNMSLIEYYIESDKIYTRQQEYLELENSYYKILAELNKNRLL